MNPNRHGHTRDQFDDHNIVEAIPSPEHWPIMTHPLQPLKSTQSSYLNKRGMNRKSGIMSTVCKSAEKTQTLCQKEERSAVQNKKTRGSD